MYLTQKFGIGMTQVGFIFDIQEFYGHGSGIGKFNHKFAAFSTQVAKGDVATKL